MSEKDPLNLIVCGTGGQGNVLLSRLLARVFSKKGYFTTIGETFGMSQRGGSVMSHVRVSRKRPYGPLVPEGRGDVILGLEPMETVKVLGSYGNPEIKVISNLRPVYPMFAITGEKDYPDPEEMKKAIRNLSHDCWLLDATQIGLDMGNPILANMVMLGALVAADVVDITAADIEEILYETFPEKVARGNVAAAERGMQAAKGQ